jgi:phage terminase large subunit-like protein
VEGEGEADEWAEKMSRSGQIYSDAKSIDLELDQSPEIGKETPRLESPRYGEASFGDSVCDWMQQHQNITPMAWQRYALNGMLEHNGTGKLRRREALISAARQNGKSTGFIEGIIGWWLTERAKEMGPQRILSSAHKLFLAESQFRRLAPILEEKFGANAFWSSGRMRCVLPDGSEWLVEAANETSGHGGSYDLICADEIWKYRKSVIFDGYRPSQIARKSPLLVMTSTAGDQSSEAFISLRGQGIAGIDSGKPDGLYFAEWSIPSSVSAEDKRYWRWANPALGTTITLEALELAAKSPDKASFLRGHLNLWVSAVAAWLPIGAWTNNKVDVCEEGPAVLAVDSSLDESRYVGVLAVAQPDGKVCCRIGFNVDTEEQMWASVKEIMNDKKVLLAITPGLHQNVPHELQIRSKSVGYGELQLYTQLIRSRIIEKQITHLGDILLEDHVSRAVAVKTNMGLAITSKKSPGPVEACRCMIWAAALAGKPPRKTSAAVYVSR